MAEEALKEVQANLFSAPAAKGTLTSYPFEIVIAVSSLEAGWDAAPYSLKRVSAQALLSTFSGDWVRSAFCC